MPRMVVNMLIVRIVVHSLPKCQMLDIVLTTSLLVSVTVIRHRKGGETLVKLSSVLMIAPTMASVRMEYVSTASLTTLARTVLFMLLTSYSSEYIINYTIYYIHSPIIKYLLSIINSILFKYL